MQASRGNSWGTKLALFEGNMLFLGWWGEGGAETNITKQTKHMKRTKRVPSMVDTSQGRLPSGRLTWHLGTVEILGRVGNGPKMLRGETNEQVTKLNHLQRCPVGITQNNLYMATNNANGEGHPRA